MEAIKNAIGLGTTTQQEGREPVSGVTGSGVGGDPYDQGNVEDSTLGGKAPQHTDSTTDDLASPSANSSTGSYTIGTGLGSNSNTTAGVISPEGATADTPSSTSASGAAIEPTSNNTTSGPHSSDIANKADPRVDSDNDKNTASVGGIGTSSWMSTALPHREGKETATSNETTSKLSTADVSGTTTQQTPHSQTQGSLAQATGLEEIKSQPPNNLPANVPTGTSTDFISPGSTASTAADTTPAHQEIPGETVGRSVSSADEPSHSLTGSRGSIEPPKPDYTDAALKPAEKGGDHGNNPDAIPLAGGKKIGEDAYTERKSIQADSLNSSTPVAADTSANTAHNVGSAEATGPTSTSAVGHEQEKSSEVSSSSGSDHKEKKSLVEKIKEKVHLHKH